MTFTEQVQRRIDELRDEYISFWVDICNIESPTSLKSGVDAVGAYITEKAKARGWKIESAHMDISGDPVCITMNPDATGAPVSLSAHMDTVHPVGLFGNPPVHCEGGKIYGPGVTDCKGGIASSFLAMAALEDCGFRSRPLKLILQSDEEFSSRTSNKETVRFMAEHSRDCVAFFNCEGGAPGFACLLRKGISRYELTVTGKAAHSSQCAKGVNAVCEMAHKIIELEKMKDADGLTCSCDIISGGTAVNTVPEECAMQIDIRFADEEQMNAADDTVRKVAGTSYLPGTTCRVKLLSRRVSMPRSEKNFALLERMNRIYREIGMTELKPEFRGGGSDAADMTSYGIPTIDCLGVFGGEIHSVREYAQLDSLTESAKRMAVVIANF